MSRIERGGDWPRSRLQRAPTPTGFEPAMLLIVYEATRGLIGAASPAEVVDVVMQLVWSLGGRVVPTDDPGPDVMPMDLSFGFGEPLAPAAPPAGIPRLNLETVLPTFLEDARGVVMSLRHRVQLEEEADCEPQTGLLSRRGLDRRLAQLRPGDAVARIAFVPSLTDPMVGAVLASLGHLLRRRVRAVDLLGRYRGNEAVVALIDVPPAVLAQRLEEVAGEWERACPHHVTLRAGVAAVATDPASAVGAAEAALVRATSGGPARIVVQ